MKLEFPLQQQGTDYVDDGYDFFLCIDFVKRFFPEKASEKIILELSNEPFEGSIQISVKVIPHFNHRSPEGKFWKWFNEEYENDYHKGWHYIYSVLQAEITKLFPEAKEGMLYVNIVSVP